MGEVERGQANVDYLNEFWRFGPKPMVSFYMVSCVQVSKIQLES